jgi:hypothetical protein
MELQQLKEIKAYKGDLVSEKKYYPQKREPGQFARVMVYSNPLVYHVAIDKFKQFKSYDRIYLSIEKKNVDNLESLYDLIKRSLLSDV